MPLSAVVLGVTDIPRHIRRLAQPLFTSIVLAPPVCVTTAGGSLPLVTRTPLPTWEPPRQQTEKRQDL